MNNTHIFQESGFPSILMPTHSSPSRSSNSPPSPPLEESFEPAPAATATATTARAQQQPKSSPIVAITNMLEDSSQLLVDYFAMTETDPATAMCDSDKHKLGKIVHILRQLARPAGSPASFPSPSFLSSAYVTGSSTSSSSRVVVNNNHQPSYSSYSSYSSMQRQQQQQPHRVTAKRSNIPSWVIVPPGTVVPPGTPAIFATINSSGPSESNCASPSPSHQLQQRSIWTESQYQLLLSEVAKYGCRFRHIYDLHGPTGTESRALADFTLTQITAKWHRGLARMNAADAAEWAAKAAMAAEAFDAQRAADAKAAAAAASSGGRGSKLWNEDEFQFLCEQVAKHGTQFKRIWIEHGPEGTKSQVLARFTTTQLQAKWHNAKKLRPELENTVPSSAAADGTADEEADDGSDDGDDSSGPVAPNRWSNDEFSFLCEQVAKYGTQYKLISTKHGANGTESQTLARFTTTQLQSKWHNTKKVQPELESLVPANARRATHDDADADANSSTSFPSNRWTSEEFDCLCEQIATHGTQFKLIHELHGPNGTQSQTLARFTPTQIQAKWHNSKKHKSESELLAAFPTSVLPNQQRTKRSRCGPRGIWNNEDIEFLCVQVLQHGGTGGLPKIWELHGPEGTESRRLAKFTLKQGRFKWYNELRGNNPRVMETKRLLVASGTAAGEAAAGGGEQRNVQEEDELADDDEDMTDNEDDASESRGADVDELTAEASPSKRPRLDDGEMVRIEDMEMGQSRQSDSGIV